MRRCAVCIVALMTLCNTKIFAQEIKGHIVDARTGEGIPYASVTIHSLPDSTMVECSIATENGAFVLEKARGERDFFLRFSSLGYHPECHTLSEFSSLSNITILMQPDDALLGEVVVTGRKKVVSLTPQGLSYAMANDPKTLAEDLLTALRRVPMLTVDGLGKLMVKGGTNYSIYLNGRPFKSANLNPTQVLSSIPATNVLRVEIITNPDASYEAESGSTIINIITQGRKVLGQSVMLSLQGETQPKGNGSIGYNLVTPRLKISLAYDYNMNMQRKQPVEILREVKLPEKSSTLSSQAQNDGIFQFHTGRLMLEAEIDSLNLLYADAHLRFTSTDYRLDWQKHYQEGAIQEKVQTKSKSIYQDGSVEFNMFYKNLRRDKQDFFSAGYRFAFSPDVRSHEGAIYQNGLSKFSKNTSKGGLWEHTVQLDIVPLRRSNFLLKTGVIGSLRRGVSNPIYYTKNEEWKEWKELNTSSEHSLLQFYRNIAGYVNANYHINSFSLSAGARIEHSSSTLTRKNSKEKTEEKHLDFIPRFSIAYQPSDASQISLNYHYLVQRPSIWLLNPFVDKIDDYNSIMGNPDLKPQSIHSIGLNSLLIGEKFFAQFAIDYVITLSPIFKRRWLREDNPQLLYESYSNGGKYQSVIPSIMVNYRPISNVSINAFGNIGGLFFHSQQGNLIQKNLIYNIQTSVDANLFKDLYIGGMYGYTQSSPILGSKNNHSHLYSFYLTMRMMEGKLALSFIMNRPFQKYSKLRAIDWGENFEQYRTNWIRANSFGVKLVYNFSVGDKSSVKRNNSLSPSDLDRSTGVK